MIQIHRLEGFYWVAREGGYARAARAFPYPITQPAVHQQVKKLEAELGRPLFERLGKDRLELTPAGDALFAFAAPFFERLPALLRDIRSGDAGGELRIGAEPLLLRQLLPAWLGRFRRRRPGAEVELLDERSPDPARLLRGDWDALVAWLPDAPEGLSLREVGRVRGWLVLPRGHPALRSRGAIDLRSLDGETFVGYPEGSRLGRVQLDALARHGLTPRRVLSAEAAETILGFVESGIGYSLVPWLDPRGPRGLNLAARRLEEEDEGLPVHLAWRGEAPENPLLEALIATAPSPGPPEGA